MSELAAQSSGRDLVLDSSVRQNGVAIADVPPWLRYVVRPPEDAQPMELRPELMPPALDAALVVKLAKLADRLDGARPEWDSELAEFNRLAGTAIPLADFQGIYKSEDAEDFVRRVLFKKALRPDAGISVAEMTEVVARVVACEDDHDFYLELFLVNCKHPSGTDLIYWPDQVPEFPQDREPTGAEVAELALRGPAPPGAAANGDPCA
jgi:hypothetical protein